MIHLFPPVALLTAKPRLSPMAARVRHHRDEIYSGQARFCLRQNRPDLKDKPLFTFPMGKLGSGFSLSKTRCVFDSLFSARGFAHRKTTIVQKSGAGPDFCEYAFRFRPDAKFAFGEFRPDLRGQPLFANEM